MTHILLHMWCRIWYLVVNQFLLSRRLGRARNGTNSASHVVWDMVYSCKSVYAAVEKPRWTRNGTNSIQMWYVI